MKLVVELLGRIYCVELSALICRSAQEGDGQVVHIGGLETSVDEEAVVLPFGFAPPAREG